MTEEKKFTQAEVDERIRPGSPVRETSPGVYE
jgi:hypothetical protein